MTNCVELMRKYNAEEASFNVKTFYAFNLLINSASAKINLFEVREFMHYVLTNDYKSLLPPNRIMPDLKHKGRNIFSDLIKGLTKAAVDKRDSKTGTAGIKRLALLSQRNPDVLLWKLLGNESAQELFRRISEEESSDNIIAKLRDCSYLIQKHLSADFYNFLTMLEPSEEQKSRVYNTISNIGGSADQDRIWDHDRILAAITMGKSHLLLLQPIDTVSIIYVLLLIQCSDINPLSTLGLFDFALQLSRLVRHECLTDLIWYRLAIMFWKINENFKVVYKKDFEILQLRECYLEGLLPVMALFCAKQVKTDTLSNNLLPKIKATMAAIFDSPVFSASSIKFLNTLLDSPLNAKHYFDRLMLKAVQGSQWPENMFTMFLYMEDFSCVALKDYGFKTISFMTDITRQYRTSSQRSEYLLVRRDKEIARAKVTITEHAKTIALNEESYRRIHKAHTSLETIYTETLREKKDLISRYNEQAQQVLELQQRVASDEKHIRSLTQVLDEHNKQIQEKLLELTEKSNDLIKNHNERELSQKLPIIKDKINALHILVYANRNNSQFSFDLFFCKYLILIYTLFNLLFNNILKNLEHPNLETIKLFRYIKSVTAGLLNYSSAIGFLQNHLQMLQEDLDCNDNMYKLDLLYKYIIMIGENLKESQPKFSATEAILLNLSFIVDISKFFTDHKLAAADSSSQILSSSKPKLLSS